MYSETRFVDCNEYSVSLYKNMGINIYRDLYLYSKVICASLINNISNYIVMYPNVKSYVIFSQRFVIFFVVYQTIFTRCTLFNSIDGRSSKSSKTVWHEINEIDLAQKFIFKDKSNFVFERHLTT
jgi:hypothetical protein